MNNINKLLKMQKEYKTRTKAEIVMRYIKGESLNELIHQFKIKKQEIEKWTDQFQHPDFNSKNNKVK